MPAASSIATIEQSRVAPAHAPASGSRGRSRTIARTPWRCGQHVEKALARGSIEVFERGALGNLLVDAAGKRGENLRLRAVGAEHRADRQLRRHRDVGERESPPAFLRRQRQGSVDHVVGDVRLLDHGTPPRRQ
jgi:hypothetical protein